MVSPQFNLDPKAQTAQGQNPTNSPGDNRVLDVNEGGVDVNSGVPTGNESLEQMAAAMNDAALQGDNVAADDIAPAPEPQPDSGPRISEQDSKRMGISDKIAAGRRNEMVEGIGVGPVVDDAPADPRQPLPTPSTDLNMNAQNIYYGQFGDDTKNFLGEEIAPPPPPPAANPVAQPQPEPGMEPGDQGAVHMITVDGEARQVTTDELVRNYSKNSSADNRIKEANQLLENAKTLATRAQGLPGQPIAGETADQSGLDTLPTDATPAIEGIDYAAIVEKIQLGETDEGAGALQDLVTQVVRSLPQQDAASRNPAALGEQVANIVQDRTQSETAREQFEQQNPDIVGDDHLYRMAHSHAHQQMVADFEAAGADPQIVEQARTDPRWTAEAHRALRVQGFPGLKSPTELYNTAGQHVRGWLNNVRGIDPGQQPTPAPSPENRPGPAPVNRQDRARTAQQSPARRQAPPQQPPAPEQVLTPQQVRSKRIAEMKVARGQLPAGQRHRAG